MSSFITDNRVSKAIGDVAEAMGNTVTTLAKTTNATAKLALETVNFTRVGQSNFLNSQLGGKDALKKAVTNHSEIVAMMEDL